MSSITGWGRGEWGDGPWGNPDSVVVTGVVGTSGLGSVTVLGDTNVTLTGVSATSALGTVITGISTTFTVTGVSATGEVGSPNIWGLVDTAQTPNWQEIAA
tara:strand:- start:263 stop:565 length:303 start_codon:yes stop_codon:yes gene_type:complete